MNLLVFWTAFVALTSLASELGFRLAVRRIRLVPPEPERAQSHSLMGALIGLLALLTGFAFAMALSRYETRRQLVVKEANVIATAFARADLLPAPFDRELRSAVVRYAHLRRELGSSRVEGVGILALLAESNRLHQQMWRTVVAAQATAPGSSFGLVAGSINTVMETREEELSAREARIPQPVTWMLLVTAATALGWVGFCAGQNGGRRILATLIFASLLATLVSLIADLDQPKHGFIRVSEAPMDRLMDSVQPEPRAPVTP